MSTTPGDPSRPSRAKLFRGSEFPRLLVLLAVLIVGVPLTWNLWSRGRKQPSRRPTTLAADIPPLPPAERSKVFAAVQDKAPLSYRENAAYSALLSRARDAKAAVLADKSRTDVYYYDLVTRPSRYRGILIHIEGTARRVRVDDEVNKDLTPDGRLYEAWVYTPESRNYPYMLVFEDAPKDLPAGADVFQKVSFDGYFFKLFLYSDGKNVPRFAPMLIGKIAVQKSLEETEAANPSLLSKIDWRAVAGGAIALYVLIRVFFSVRRLIFPAPRAAARKRLPGEFIEPEKLADWLADGPPAEKPTNGLNGSHPPHERDPLA